jgi:hypothetical protein
MNEANKENIEVLSNNEQPVSAGMPNDKKDENFTNDLNKYLDLLNGSTASYVLGYN